MLVASDEELGMLCGMVREPGFVSLWGSEPVYKILLPELEKRLKGDWVDNGGPGDPMISENCAFFGDAQEHEISAPLDIRDDLS